MLPSFSSSLGVDFRIWCIGKMYTRAWRIWLNIFSVQPELKLTWSSTYLGHTLARFQLNIYWKPVVLQALVRRPIFWQFCKVSLPTSCPKGSSCDGKRRNRWRGYPGAKKLPVNEIGWQKLWFLPLMYSSAVQIWLVLSYLLIIGEGACRNLREDE